MIILLLLLRFFLAQDISGTTQGSVNEPQSGYGITIQEPKTGIHWYEGDSESILWKIDPSLVTVPSLDIELWKVTNASEIHIYTFAHNVSVNQLLYSWRVPLVIKSSNRYRVVFMTSYWALRRNYPQITVETQSFWLHSRPSYAVFQNPALGDSFSFEENISIDWYTQGDFTYELGEIRLIQVGVTEVILDTILADLLLQNDTQSVNWTIPQSYDGVTNDPNQYYALELVDSLTESSIGKSQPFKIHWNISQDTYSPPSLPENQQNSNIYPLWWAIFIALILFIIILVVFIILYRKKVKEMKWFRKNFVLPFHHTGHPLHSNASFETIRRSWIEWSQNRVNHLSPADHTNQQSNEPVMNQVEAEVLIQPKRKEKKRWFSSPNRNQIDPEIDAQQMKKEKKKWYTLNSKNQIEPTSTSSSAEALNNEINNQDSDKKRDFAIEKPSNAWKERLQFVRPKVDTGLKRKKEFDARTI